LPSGARAFGGRIFVTPTFKNTSPANPGFGYTDFCTC